MSFCYYCGAKMEDGTEFCPECGAWTGENVPKAPVTDNLAAMAEDVSEPEQPSAPETADTAPEAESVMEEPAAAMPADDKVTRRKRNPVWVFLSALIVIGCVVGYWFLPGNRYARLMDRAQSYMDGGDLTASAECCFRALDIYPEDEAAQDLLKDLYGRTLSLCKEQLGGGSYEAALEMARTANRMLTEPGTDSDLNLYEVYDGWARSCAEAGKDEEADAVIAAAAEEISDPALSSAIRQGVESIREFRDTVERIRDLSAEALQSDSSRDYAAVYGVMDAARSDIMSIYSSDSRRFPVTVESGGTALTWSYDPGRDALQLSISGRSGGEDDPESRDTYLVTGAADSPLYEFFSCGWQSGIPQGDYYEIDFAAEPVESASNFVIYGAVTDGMYDGPQTIEAGGKTYYAHFEGGKVILLDTTDPNGDSCNVIAYTADKNSWLSYPDSMLDLLFGIRFIQE